MIKRFALAALLALLPAVALAQVGPAAQPDSYTSPSGGKVLSGVVQTLGYDSVTGIPCIIGKTATCAAPSPTIANTNFGGYDSGSVQVTATPANSSHAAGVSVGGLFTLAMARTNGGSGELTQVRFKSSGGSTGSYTVRIWQKSPANTTCTDNTNFAGSATDDANLVTPPFTLTLGAPGSTTGDSNTYGSVTSVNFGFVNADTSPGKNLYACVVTNATDTADENAAVYVTLTAIQN